jgi:2,7-dihydroxy-5-methyl-1-naphthoate 7-O-methyltransferase
MADKDEGSRFAQAVGAPEDTALTRLFELTDMVTPMAVRVAATLRVADLISAGTDTVADLAAKTGTDQVALTRVLRHLAGAGFFTQAEPDRYALTDLARPLLAGHPAGLRSWLDLDGAIGRSDLAFARMLDSVRSGGPSYAAMFGRPYWDDLNANPALRASFDALMAAQLAGDGADVVAAYDWSRAASVVDVGGGDGTQLVQILRAFPAVRGIIVEQAATAAAATRNLAAHGLADRCDVVAGSFFDPLPAGGSIYLLSGVLHDWQDEQAGQILNRCAQATRTGGHVIIAERPVDPEHPAPSTAMDLRMLVTLGGRERTLGEYRSLAAAAGLEIFEVVPAGSRFLLDCLPVSAAPRRA